MITLNIFQSATWLKKTKKLAFYSLNAAAKITAKIHSTTINSNLSALYFTLSSPCIFAQIISEFFIQACKIANDLKQHFFQLNAFACADNALMKKLTTNSQCSACSFLLIKGLSKKNASSKHLPLSILKNNSA